MVRGIERRHSEPRRRGLPPPPPTYDDESYDNEFSSDPLEFILEPTDTSFGRQFCRNPDCPNHHPKNRQMLDSLSFEEHRRSAQEYQKVKLYRRLQSSLAAKYREDGWQSDWPVLEAISQIDVLRAKLGDVELRGLVDECPLRALLCITQAFEQARAEFWRISGKERDRQLLEDLEYVFKASGCDEQSAVAKAKKELDRLLDWRGQF